MNKRKKTIFVFVFSLMMALFLFSTVQATTKNYPYSYKFSSKKPDSESDQAPRWHGEISTDQPIADYPGKLIFWETVGSDGKIYKGFIRSGQIVGFEKRQVGDEIKEYPKEIGFMVSPTEFKLYAIDETLTLERPPLKRPGAKKKKEKIKKEDDEPPAPPLPPQSTKK